MARSLPEFVEPMLARLGEPFDSDEHLFEIKWDGIRAVGIIEGGGFRLTSRNRLDLTPRYPEMDFLAELAPGTILDGELVVVEEGRSDFELALSRSQARDPGAVRRLARTRPAIYVVFDVLYRDFRSTMGRDLRARRAVLEELVRPHENPHLMVSDGVVGGGRSFYEEACRQNLEGIVAKRLASRYLPGKRPDSWTKIKSRTTVPCLVIGWLPADDRPNDFKSLLVATEIEGQLTYVGRVGSGIGDDVRARLNALLRARPQETPLVACPEKGHWVEPGLFCNVSYGERTRGGMLRAPVFHDLVEE